MKKFSQINEEQDVDLIFNIINDIDKLIYNLEYLKQFLNDKANSDNYLDIYRSITVVHTDIQLLSNKIKKK